MILKGATPMNLKSMKSMIAALMVVGMIATLAVAQNMAGSVEPQAKKRNLTGTWLLTITPDEPGAPPFEGLYTFTSDGIALFSSVGPPIPGLGNPGHGVWVRTGPNTFAVTWKQFTFDDIYTCNGSLVLRSTITFSSDDAYTSVDTGRVLDLSGHTIVNIGGTHEGRRMKVE